MSDAAIIALCSLITTVAGFWYTWKRENRSREWANEDRRQSAEDRRKTVTVTRQEAEVSRQMLADKIDEVQAAVAENTAITQERQG
jgi:hypothetical protein